MKTFKFKEWDCVLSKGKYSNGRTALSLIEDKTGEPIAVATINYTDVDMAPDCVAIKNYSENEGMVEALTKANIIGEKVGEVHQTFVTVPVYKLIDP